MSNDADKSGNWVNLNHEFLMNYFLDRVDKTKTLFSIRPWFRGAKVRVTQREDREEEVTTNAMRKENIPIKTVPHLNYTSLPRLSSVEFYNWIKQFPTATIIKWF